MEVVLLAEGGSDRVLEAPLAWLLCRIDPAHAYNVRYKDLRLLPDPPDALRARIAHVLRNETCDLLVVHRDRDKHTVAARRSEIRTAAVDAGTGSDMTIVPVVPVHMTEAWLLFDERAIREAARNPNGTVELELPTGREAEDIDDPKQRLHSLLRRASELRGRRLRKFNVGSAVHRVADCIEDWAPLESFGAFRTLRADLEAILHRNVQS